MNIIVYTDGAYSRKINKGGIGIVIKHNNNIRTFKKCFINTTNNRMELLAIIYAFKFFKTKVSSITFYSDSQYVISTITKNWQRKKNKDLWNLFDKEYDRIKTLCNTIDFIWVKGHADNMYNNICDKLAVEAYLND